MRPLVEAHQTATLEAYGKAYAATLAATKDETAARAAGEAAAAAHRPPPAARCVGKWDTLNVVPLVVTDNLEGLAASRTTDTATQMGLALLATIANVGASGQFSQMREALRRSRGNDSNSLLTVARLTDDTVRVRLGAAQSPRLGNTMLPRTHNISLLVIYRPCEDNILAEGEERIISTVARASYTDVFNGQQLPYKPAAQRLFGLTRELNRKYNNRFSYLEYAGLYRLVAQQNRDRYQEFFNDKIRRFKDVKDKKGRGCIGLSNDPGFLANLLYPNLFRPKDKAGEDFLFDEMKDLPYDCYREQLAFQVASNTLWTDLQSIRPFPEYSYANIPVVLQRIQPELPSDQQTVFVNVGDSGASVTLFNGRHLKPARELTASLTLTPVTREKKEGSKEAGAADLKEAFSIPASSVTVSDDGTTITAKFPSFAGISLREPKNEAVRFDPSKLELTVGRMEDGRRLVDATVKPKKEKDFPVTASYDDLRLVPEKKPSEPTIVYALDAPAAAILVGPDGKGRLSVQVRKTKADTPVTGLRLKVDGAEVTSLFDQAGAPVHDKGTGWEIAGDGRFTFGFDNLIPGQQVKIAIVSYDGKAETPLGAVVTKPIYGRLPAAKE
jgi:hypothetical protein